MRLAILLRPSLLASLLAHAALVAAGALAVGGAVRDRDPRILSFLTSEDAGVVEVAEVPPSLAAPEIDAAVAAPPAPQEPPPPDDPEAPAFESGAETSVASPVLDPVPVGVRARPRAEPAPAPSPVAAPASPPSRAGVGRTVDAVGRPENLPPVYPPQARARGWAGTVVLDVTVRPDGTVGDVRVDRSSGFPALDEAALAAARAWRYDPRLVDGVAVPDRLLVDVTFRLVER